MWSTASWPPRKRLVSPVDEIAVKVPGVEEPVAAWPAAAYSTLGCTAPTNIRPPSVISTETRLVRSSRPLPQAPLTGVADCSSAFSTAALSPEGLCPGTPAAAGRGQPGGGQVEHGQPARSDGG